MIETELLQKGNRSLAELAEKIKQFGPGLADKMPLNVLFRWQNPEFLTKEEQGYQIPEWHSLKRDLNQFEKAMVSRAFGSAIRAKINTLGELRTMKESQIAVLVPEGSRISVGSKAAKFLKMGFS